jgi:hypothetical protein
MTMSVTLTFSPETEARIQEWATQKGHTVEVFLQQLVEREILGVNGSQTPAAVPTFEQVCAPIAAAVAASGMTDDEVRDFLTGIRDEIRAEKRAQRTQG